MRFSRVVLLGAVAALATGIFSSSALAVPATETIMLDSHEAPSVGFAGPVSSTQALTANTYYVATVSGTYSLWKSSFWAQGTCKGTPLNSPEFPTAGISNSKTGVDADTIFAAAKGAGACTAALPKHFDVFQIYVQGSSWSHVEPTRGALNTPTTDHTYKYALHLGSSVAPFQFRIRDYHTADNYGQLQIQLRKAWDGDCSNFGYRDFGFNNQNQCTSALPNS
jgi:hypothetical protein